MDIVTHIAMWAHTLVQSHQHSSVDSPLQLLAISDTESEVKVSKVCPQGPSPMHYYNKVQCAIECESEVEVIKVHFCFFLSSCSVHSVGLTSSLALRPISGSP